MGIDARILIRGVPRSQVSEGWLKELSWRLAEAIGAEHFWLNDSPLSAEEADAARDAWHAAFTAHPRYTEYETTRKASFDRDDPLGLSAAVVEKTKAVDAIRDAIRADLGPPPPDARRLAVEPTGTHYRKDGDPLPGLVYQQDGPDVVANVGECLLRVNLSGRWYGIGYERGDLLTYCAVAEWLEVNVPGCQVWYGGDSSGVLVERFGPITREKLRRHLYSVQGRDYFDYDKSGLLSGRDAVTGPPACSLCPGGEYRGARCGWGNGYALFDCRGCGKQLVTRDGGKTYAPQTEKF